MSDIKIKPLFDYLLIEPVEQETQTSSGIIIPDTATKEKPQKGTVVAAGPGRKNSKGELVKTEIKKGDVVMYKKWGSSEELKIDGKEYVMVKEEDLIAIYEG